MATMADVARYAGVNKQTVSNVITGQAKVKEQTRQRVLQAIEALEYRPNLVARGLSKGKTSTIAIVVPTIANPFYSEVVEEVERLVEGRQHSLVLCTTQSEPERLHRQLQVLADRHIDGILFARDRRIEQEFPTLVRFTVPIIFWCWERKPYPDMFSLIDMDFYHAGYLAGQHLLESGHRHRIAIIFEAPDHEPRLAGFREALLTAGVELPSSLMIGVDSATYENGYRVAQNLLTGDSIPAAIFATTDWMALGVMDAARDLGIRIPEDLSLVGLDDLIRSAYTHPPLTTIVFPKREMAREMTELLFRRIGQETPQPALVTLLRPQLVVRSSTGHPHS